MLPLFFIFVYELAQAGIILILPSIDISLAASYFFIMFFLQVLFSPIQGLISDHYCRKKSVVFALMAVAIGQLFIYYSFQLGIALFLIGLIVNSALGNADVIARAAFIDIHVLKNRRKVISWTYIAQVLPWALTAVFLLLGKKYSNQIFFYYFILSILSALGGLLFFKDERDLDKHKKLHHVVIRDIQESFHSLKQKKYYIGFIGLLFFTISFNFSFYYQNEVIVARALQSEMMIFYSIGSIAGVLSLMHLEFSNKRAILWGLVLGLIGYLSSTCIALANTTWLEQSFGYFLLFFSAGLCIPSIFAYFSLEHTIHEQGKVFGILDSIQTIGEMIAAFFLLFATVFAPSIIGLIAVLIFVIAIFCFKKHLTEN